MRARVMMHGDHGSGLEFELGDADAVFHEKDFFGAAVKNVEAAVVFRVSGIPVSGRVADLVVLQEFDINVAKGLVAKIADDVDDAAGEKSGLSILQFDGDGVFALHGVEDFGVAEVDVNVVVAMAVEKSFAVRRDLDGEHADLGVGEGLVVVRLGGDFDFLVGLCREESGEEQEE